MGLLKKIFKPVAKVLDKVIPNEIKPVLPYLSAVAPFMLPAGFGAGFGSGIFNSSVAQQMAARGLLGAGLNIGSQLAQEGNEGDINLLRAGIAAVPAALSAPGAANFIRTGQTISGTPLSQVALEGGSTDLFTGGFGEGFKNVGLEALAKGSEFFGGAATEGAKVFGPGEATLKGAATIAKGVTPSLTTEAGFEAAEYAKKALADYEKELAEFNALTAANKQASDMDRATAIYNSMTNAGAFTVDTIKETLGQLGLPSDFFAGGGVVGLGRRKGYKIGALVNLGKTVQKGYGKLKNFLARMTDDVEIETFADYADDSGASLDIYLTPKSKKGKKALDELVEEGSVSPQNEFGKYYVKDSEDFIGGAIEKDIKASGIIDSGEYTSFKQGAGLSEYGEPYYGYDTVIQAFDRSKRAEGGLMNLRMGGMPAEIDARQSGGFIPIGKAERADDVPARLSQNEFVMTADAVRGMGQGNINLGAQRMYDIMKQYEPIGKALG